MSDGYTFTDEMGEVSGLGGDYERACRDMVIAGAKWLDENPDAALEVSEIANVLGVVKARNEASEDLMETMEEELTETGRSAPTGAMMQACVRHVLYIAEEDWEEYVEMMEEDDG